MQDVTCELAKHDGVKHNGKACGGIGVITIFSLIVEKAGILLADIFRLELSLYDVRLLAAPRLTWLGRACCGGHACSFGTLYRGTRMP